MAATAVVLAVSGEHSMKVRSRRHAGARRLLAAQGRGATGTRRRLMARDVPAECGIALKEDGAAAAPSQQLGCRERVAAAGEVGDQLGMWLQNGARLGAPAPVHEHAGPAGCGA